MVHRLVLGKGFECFVGMVILFQLVFIAWEVDARTSLVSGGSTIAPDAYDQAMQQLTVAKAINIIFLVFYVGECGLRWAVSRKTFWAVGWNLMDVVVLFLDFLGTAISLAMDDPTSVIPRLFRILRLVRVSRIFIAFRAFNELLSALRTCIATLLWGSALLMVTIILWSIVSVEFLHPLTSQFSRSICIWCPGAFRSVAAARATLLQIAFGDGWGDVVRPLIANDFSASIILGSFIFVVCLWLFNMIVGAFLDAMLHLRGQNSDAIARQREAEREKAWSLFKKLCADLDSRSTTGDTVYELRRRLASAPPYFKAMGVDESDLEDVGRSCGELTFTELHDELQHMKSLEIRRALYVVQRQLARQQELLYSIAVRDASPQFGTEEPHIPDHGNGPLNHSSSNLQSSAWSKRHTAVFGSYESKNSCGSSNEKLMSVPPSQQHQQQQQEQQQQQQQFQQLQQAGWYLYGFYGSAPPDVASMSFPDCVTDLVKAEGPSSNLVTRESLKEHFVERISFEKNSSTTVALSCAPEGCAPCFSADKSRDSKRDSLKRDSLSQRDSFCMASMRDSSYSKASAGSNKNSLGSGSSGRSADAQAVAGDAEAEKRLSAPSDQRALAPPQAGAKAPPRPLCTKDNVVEAVSGAELADALRRFRGKLYPTQGSLGGSGADAGGRVPGLGLGSKGAGEVCPSPLWSARSASEDHLRNSPGSSEDLAGKAPSGSSVCTFAAGKGNSMFPSEHSDAVQAAGISEVVDGKGKAQGTRVSNGVRDRQKPLMTFTPERDRAAMLPHRAGTFDEPPTEGQEKETRYAKQIWADGAQYEGDWVDGKAHGNGRLLRPDKAIYDGQWNMGEAHGKGTYFHADGSVYEGEWERDGQHGVGKEVWRDGSSFTGSYHAGMKHGRGCFKWADGAQYQGELSENRIHGAGFYSWPDGSTYEGQWRNDLMSGTGLLTGPDGMRFVVKYSDGELVSKEQVRYHDAPAGNAEGQDGAAQGGHVARDVSRFQGE